MQISHHVRQCDIMIGRHTQAGSGQQRNLQSFLGMETGTFEKKHQYILLFGTFDDTGGQPAFLEMLPALTMGPALYLIFFRLNQELKQTYEILHVSKKNEQVLLGDSSYTVDEVIFQALSSIACFSCASGKKDSLVPRPRIRIRGLGTRLVRKITHHFHLMLLYLGKGHKKWRKYSFVLSSFKLVVCM